MAGDWMKIELELPDKPEVHAIASMLNLDCDAVVGKLIRVWQWFDKHTTDGNAYGVTFSLVDRITSVTGFGEAMSFAGWMEQRDKTLHMPKFDRHTSESAKKRALTAKRVAKHKEKTNAEGNAVGVSEALPREEKRREEVNTSSEPSGFAEFWSAYPKKVGKAEARKAFAKAKINGHLPDVLQAIAEQSASDQWRKDGGQFIPNPATWIRQGRWEDESISLAPRARQLAI